MAAIAISSPIIPDKLDQWKAWSENLNLEPRRSEFTRFIKESGLSRIRCWLQEGFGDPIGIILYEGENPAGFFESMSASREPFAIWFREQVMECNGMDLNQSMGAPPKLVTDVSAS